MTTDPANDWIASNWGAALDGPCCAVAVASDGATHAACRTVVDALFEARADLARVTRERDEARAELVEVTERATMAGLKLAGCHESRVGLVNQHNALAGQWIHERDKAEAERDAYRDVVDKARVAVDVWRNGYGTGARVIEPLRILAAAVDHVDTKEPASASD